MPHVDVVCGPMDIPRLPDILADLADRRQQVLATDACGPVDVPRSVAHRPNPFQAFVAIMRGCDNFCAYCVVPFVRGREHSRPVADILDEARRLLDDGVKEITLLGQNVNSYGVGLAEHATLPDLLRRLDARPGLQRLRFVTSHPKDASDELFRAMAALPSVCPHLHLPAQAGSNRILAAMNRRYSREHYLDRVARAKELVPGLELASDFIVGFPSETDAEFEETVDLVQRVEFQNCFIFKYSPRPGTAAASLPDDVPRPTKEARNHRLLAVQHAIMERRQAAMVGRTLDILVEGISSHDPTKLIGRSPANHIVAFPGPGALAGETLPILITASTPLTLFGRRAAVAAD
jgi:tRNA-2-methylthio-N6-dimethylallyladenosine synthase